MEGLIDHQSFPGLPIGKLCDHLVEQGKVDPVSVHFSEMIMSNLNQTEVSSASQQNYLILLCILVMEHMLKQHSCVNAHWGPISNWLILSSDELNLIIPIPPANEIDTWLNKTTSIFELVDDINAFSPGSAQVKPFVRWQNRIYLHRYFMAEWQIFRRVNQSLTQNKLSDLSANQSEMAFVDLMFIDNVSNQETDWQRESVINSMRSAFSVICGGPGTGKTTTVVKLLAGLVYHHSQNNAGTSLRIAVTAPTGKAALRLEESIADALDALDIEQSIKQLIPKKASTIHRVMGSRGNGSYAYYASNPLPLDILLIDEASMIDVILMSKVFCALPSHCRIVLIGDRQQLASVEAGNVLADFYYAQKNLNTQFLVELKKSWRFSDESPIGKLSASINDGRAKDVLKVLNADKNISASIGWLRDPITDINVLIETTVNQFVELAAMLSSITVENEMSVIEQAFTLIKQRQLLCCLRKSETGTEYLNQKVYSRLAQKGKIPKNESHYLARPIMISANAYNLKLYNGDIGIQCVDPVSGLLMTYFQQGTKGFSKFHCQRLPAHESVYAMTVHKSQGSEFDHATLILPLEGDKLTSVTKEIVYTGLTRAKRGFTLVAQETVLLSAIKQKTNRQSGLGNMLVSH